MITRLSIPIDILHDERIVALVIDCGPESVAVLISLLAIMRRRGVVNRNRNLIVKIRHDLSFSVEEAAINAVIDHLLDSGYLHLGEDGIALQGEACVKRKGEVISGDPSPIPASPSISPEATSSSIPPDIAKTSPPRPKQSQFSAFARPPA